MNVPCLVCRRKADAMHVIGGKKVALCDGCATDEYRYAEAIRRSMEAK